MKPPKRRRSRPRPTSSAPKRSAAAGMSTDADVLSIRVHLAGMREQVLERQQDVAVARAALNEAMGCRSRYRV